MSRSIRTHSLAVQVLVLVLYFPPADIFLRFSAIHFAMNTRCVCMHRRRWMGSMVKCSSPCVVATAATALPCASETNLPLMRRETVGGMDGSASKLTLSRTAGHDDDDGARGSECSRLFTYLSSVFILLCTENITFHPEELERRATRRCVSNEVVKGTKFFLLVEP